MWIFADGDIKFVSDITIVYSALDFINQNTRTDNNKYQLVVIIDILTKNKLMLFCQ